MGAEQADSPMIRQYQGIKEQHPNKLLFFRMGDFYELFFADAERVAVLLGLTLTKRRSIGAPIPMAGVPAHSVEQYISRLVRIGEAVVICEQVGTVEGKGLMERQVTQIVTPGTLTDIALLPQRDAVVALALAPHSKADQPTGYAWLDLARGELRAGECAPKQLAALIARLQPAELLLPDGAGVPVGVTVVVNHLPDWEFAVATAQHRMCERFSVRDLRGFGLAEAPQAVAAAMALLGYAEHTQCQQLEHLWQIGVEHTEELVVLDAAARRSLEISESLMADGPTLRSTIDACATAAGSRLLQRRLQHPVRNRSELEARQDCNAAVVPVAAELARWLQGRGDLERVITRISLGSVRPRELSVIRDLLIDLVGLCEVLTTASIANEQLAAIHADHSEVAARLTALAAEPPALLRDGGAIALGHDAALDEQRALAAGSVEMLAAIEERERSTTGLSSLRIGHNRVHGFYLEVSRTQSDKVPDHYQRRQTLKHAERFLIDELAELEEKQIAATDQVAELERELYLQLLADLRPRLTDLRLLAEALAELDLAVNLAQLAQRCNWVRPEYLDEACVHIKGGCHPVVAATVDHFVPNNTSLETTQRMQVVTGPNMGGKSTYMRQVALIAVLALAGMPVPAVSAAIGPLDSIQTRIGAADDLAGGRSTFMVEMAETAAILNTAGPASLVLLDEIGRGTSTFDGMSLAWATAQALLERNRSLVLLATHYLELAELADGADGATNVHMAVGEAGGEVVMLHRVETGSANRSFGLQVARMAGIPAHVLGNATALLKELEQRQHAQGGEQSNLFGATQATLNQPELSAALERLRGVSPDSLSPREALELLYELHALDRES